MPALDLFLSIFISIYALVLTILAIGLFFYRSPRSVSVVFASVLVAARNEEANIENCLRALYGQDYPADLYEVIVIDDRSTDRTASIVRSLQAQYSNLRLVTISELSKDMAPKKHALNEAIKVSRGEILVCTDADCRPERHWLSSMISCFRSDTGMVVGYSPIEPKRRFSLLHNFVALDSLTLASLSAAGTAFGVTLTATGRSLAYRKETFHEVGGFSKIARFVSGDDDLLLGLVKKTKWKTAYGIDAKALVFTDPPGSISQFMHQKVRQASKSLNYSFRMITALFLTYFFNLLLVTYVPYEIFFGRSDSALYVSIFLVKLLSELFLLSIGAWRFKVGRFLPFYPVFACIHPIHVVVFGAWGLFGKYQWKDSSSKMAENKS